MRKKVRFGIGGIFALMGLGILVGGLRFLMLPSTLPIRQVKVVGDYRFVDASQLQLALMPYVSQGFFGLKVRAAERAILALPGIEEVSVRRIFPGTLSIRVLEKTPEAFLPDGEIYATDGTAFLPLRAFPSKDLPVFAGSLQDLPSIASFYQEAKPLLEQDGLHLNYVACDGLGSWTLGTREGMTVMLGRTDLLARLHRLTDNYGILEKINQNQIPTRVDLRYNLGFSAAYAEPTRGSGSHSAVS